MSQRYSRRDFFRTAGAAAVGGGLIPFLGCARESSGPAQAGPARTIGDGLAVVKGADPRASLRKAIESLGGLGKLVRSGDTVVVKPNIAWDRAPEQAANTNPDVVAELIAMCLEADAARVLVFDRAVNDPRRTYDRSGIADAARDAGAAVQYPDDRDFAEIAIAKGVTLSAWPAYQPALAADVFINVPVAKHHSRTGLTLGMKNLMGIMGGDRGLIHEDIHQKLADFATAVPVHLTVMDATHIMVANGPIGGRLEDVQHPDTIIVGADRVAVDAYTTRLFGQEPQDVGYITAAAKLGLGQIDITKVNVKALEV